jgi:hypothetical protein
MIYVLAPSASMDLERLWQHRKSRSGCRLARADRVGFVRDLRKYIAQLRQPDRLAAECEQ